VTPDKIFVAIGKGGQNVGLAAKLTGWKIDIKGTELQEAPVAEEDQAEGEDFVPLQNLAASTPEETKTEDVASEPVSEEPKAEESTS